MPLIRLSLVWACVLGGVGAFFPFFSLYLRENAGLSGTEVGIVMSIPPLVGLVMQPLWGQIGDRTGARARVLAVVVFCASLGYASMALPETFAGFVFATLFLSLFAVAMMPTLVSVSLALLRESGGHRLGRVRVWGTVGFGIVVGTFPLLLRALPGGEDGARGGDIAAPGVPGLEWMFGVASGLIGLAALLCLWLPRGDGEAIRAQRGDWRLLLRQPDFLRLLAFAFVAYLCLQGPMALFPLLVRAQGGGVEAVSQMWLIMLALEVPLVAGLGRSVSWLGLRGLIAAGMVGGALRWLASGFGPNLTVVTAAQILHGVTVWGIILGTPLYVDAIVPERLRSTGQGLLAMIGVSLGGFLSVLLSGWLTDRFDPTAPARIGGIAALLLTLAIPWLLPEPRREAEPLAESGDQPA